MTNKFKMPMITGCALGLLVFIAFYYFDFRKFNSEIDKLFYRQYGITAGKYQNVTGNYSDGTDNYTKALIFTPTNPAFEIASLARTDNGFYISEMTMPDIKYKYKTKQRKNGNPFWGTEYIKPEKVTDPAVIYRYAFLRTISSGKPAGSSIQQVSYYSILNFPKLKSRFFNINDVTSNQYVNRSDFNLQYSGMSFNYYDGTPCSIEYKTRLFLIGRIYKTTVIYLLGFIILGGLLGFISKYAIRK